MATPHRRFSPCSSFQEARLGSLGWSSCSIRHSGVGLSAWWVFLSCVTLGRGLNLSDSGFCVFSRGIIEPVHQSMWGFYTYTWKHLAGWIISSPLQSCHQGISYVSHTHWLWISYSSVSYQGSGVRGLILQGYWTCSRTILSNV